MKTCNWCGNGYEGGLSLSANPFGGFCSDRCAAEAKGQNGGGSSVAGGQEGLAILGIIIIVVVLALFLAPAILVIWPFDGSLTGAFGIAAQSLWAWIGSAVFWATLGAMIYWPRTQRTTITARKTELPSNVPEVAALSKESSLSQKDTIVAPPEPTANRKTTAQQEWYVRKDSKEKLGPFSAAQLKQLAKSGKLSPTDLIWREGLEKWMSATNAKGLFPK